MKKLLLTLALAVTTTLCHGQGIIAFGNSALTKVRICDNGNFRNPTSSEGLVFGVFVNGSETPAGPVVGIGANAGIINAPSVYALAGTYEGEIVSLQIRAWDGGLDWRQARLYYGETDVRQVTLGPTAGPGQVIWQTASGTNPNRFLPLTIYLDYPCPEPTTLALGALAGLSLLFCRRKRL